MGYRVSLLVARIPITTPKKLPSPNVIRSPVVYTHQDGNIFYFVIFVCKVPGSVVEEDCRSRTDIDTCVISNCMYIYIYICAKYIHIHIHIHIHIYIYICTYYIYRTNYKLHYIRYYIIWY